MEYILTPVVIVIYGIGCYYFGRKNMADELVESGDLEKFIDEDGDVAYRAKKDREAA